MRILALARPGIGGSDRSVSHGRQGGRLGGRRVGRGVAPWACERASRRSGWSAGGPFALACAAGLSGRVTRAATVGGMAPLEAPLSARQLGLRLDQVLFPMSLRRPAAGSRSWMRASALVPARLVHSSLARSLPPEDRSVVAEMTPAEAASGLRDATRQGPGGGRDDYAVLAGDWGFALSDVAVPVTVFQGAADTLLPRAHAEALAGQLPTGRLEVIDGAGHFLLHPHLDRVLDALVD